MREIVVYNYDRLTGAFGGVGRALESPLEENVFHIPAFATTIAPPEFSKGKIPVFINNAWSIVNDHRGEIWFTVDGYPVLITFIGDPKEKLLLADKPDVGETIPDIPEYTSPEVSNMKISVTARQLKIWLANNDLLDTVEAEIDSLQGKEGVIAKIEWKESSTFEKDHQLLINLAKKCGMTEVDIDNAFMEASLI